MHAFDGRADRMALAIPCVALHAVARGKHYDIQGGPKKVSQKLMTITLSNLNGFSKFFHHSKENFIVNKPM